MTTNVHLEKQPKEVGFIYFRGVTFKDRVKRFEHYGQWMWNVGFENKCWE